MVERFEEHMRI